MKIKSPSSNSIEFGSHEPTFGCVSAILRHLRCRHRISISENYTKAVEFSTTETKPQSPNIVARLMGLDSIPISPNSGNSNSFSRSRSRNSVESWPGILTERTNASPTDSSVSFHEKPIYLREENDDFLILTFTPDENAQESLSDWGKCRSINTIQKKKRRIRRKSRGEKCMSDSCEEKENCRKLESVKRKEGFVKCDKNRELPLILDLEKIKLIQKKVETDCISQNSSPVSVLDLPEPNDECPTQPNSPNSDAEGAKAEEKPRCPRRKLSSNFNNLEGSLSSSNIQANKESDKFNICIITLRDKTVLKHFVEEDFKNSIWVEKEIKKPVHAEETATEIGFEILDALLSETASEMCSNLN